MRVAAAAALGAALASACATELGPLMAPGEDCLACHDGRAAPRWTAAGTFPGRGRTVVLADAAGKTLTLRTNRVGNFYTAEPLAYPLRATVDGLAMPLPVEYGGCNRCHGPGGDLTGGGAYGPLMLPAHDCLACHDGSQARRWTAAGTWTRAGATVVLADAAGKTVTLTTNAVGNFYTAEPLAFPIRPSVDGVAMPLPATSGSCNACHANGQNTGGGGAYGPLMAPGEDCLACHDGTTATRWTAAGTWGGPGNAVVLVDAAGKRVALTTNAVGNFFTAEPLAFPIVPFVNGERMDPPAELGSCNRCHGPGGG